MKLEKVKLSELKLWDKNPRSINQKDFQRLKNQILKLKQYKPLIVNQDNIILGGNMRYRAFQDLGINEVYIIRVNTNSEKENIEIALSDNDNAGYYNEMQLQELVYEYKDEINLDDYKISLGKDINLKEIIDRCYDINNIGWNPDKFDEVIDGDGIKELIYYGLQSFWKDIRNENAKVYNYILDLPFQNKKKDLVKQRYSKTNLEEIQRIILTYMREKDYFLENCCGWSTFGSSAKYFGYSGVGVDIWDIAIEHSKKQIEMVQGKGKVEIKKMNGLNLKFNDETFDFVYCNPPFMDEEKYSGDKNDIADKNFNNFYKKFKQLMKENYRVLKKDKLCVITINDKREKSFLIPMQKYVIDCGYEAGFKLWDFVVAEVLSQKIRLRKKEYKQKRTVKCHEYIIVFKKI